MISTQFSRKFQAPCHNGWFWGILSKKYLRQISILGTKEYKIRENKGTFILSILKVVITRVPLFFPILHSLVPTIEICLRWFMDKNCPKRPKCSVDANFRVSPKIRTVVQKKNTTFHAQVSPARKFTQTRGGVRR